ncbi:hypothetical protein [Aquisediminimonas sediminicola]|uniref:hypothetical protein n=1 Tax=Alteraquisediminimonas sediminicola TaxID=2676787 RepID=UPI001C8E05C3|nr:hypothetical protein [Aquisediminimonas sediminicola]
MSAVLRFGGFMVSCVKNDDLGRGRSRTIRTQKADHLLWEIRSVILALARQGELETTLAGIVGQLNARGLRTNQNNKFDAQKVHRALGLMGVDRMSIRRWKNYAGRMAAQFDVTFNQMVGQLWHEWLWHESTKWIDEGVTLIGRDRHPFIPHLVHPDQWVPPWVREPDGPLREVPATPPAARVVYAMLGAFDHED